MRAYRFIHMSSVNWCEVGIQEKINVEGEEEYYKARLMVKDYTQQELTMMKYFL